MCNSLYKSESCAHSTVEDCDDVDEQIKEMFYEGPVANFHFRGPKLF